MEISDKKREEIRSQIFPAFSLYYKSSKILELKTVIAKVVSYASSTASR